MQNTFIKEIDFNDYILNIRAITSFIKKGAKN